MSALTTSYESFRLPRLPFCEVNTPTLDLLALLGPNRPV